MKKRVVIAFVFQLLCLSAGLALGDYYKLFPEPITPFPNPTIFGNIFTDNITANPGGPWTITGYNDASGDSILGYGGFYGTQSFLGDFVANNNVVTVDQDASPADFVPGNQVMAHNMGDACTTIDCTTAPSAPTLVSTVSVLPSQMIPLTSAYTITVTGCSGDLPDGKGPRLRWNQKGWLVTTGTPAQGQYSVTASAGSCVYTFNAADAGKLMDFFYLPSAVPTSAPTATYSYYEVARDGSKGGTPISASTSMTTTVITEPTYTTPINVTVSQVMGAYAIDVCKQVNGGLPQWVGRAWNNQKSITDYGQAPWIQEDANPCFVGNTECSGVGVPQSCCTGSGTGHCINNSAAGMNDDFMGTITAVDLNASTVTFDSYPQVTGTQYVRHENINAFNAWVSDSISASPPGYAGGTLLIPANTQMRINQMAINVTGGGDWVIKGGGVRTSQIILTGDGNGQPCNNSVGGSCATGDVVMNGVTNGKVEDLLVTQTDSSTSDFFTAAAGFANIRLNNVTFGGGGGVTSCAAPGNSHTTGIYLHDLDFYGSQVYETVDCFEYPIVATGAVNVLDMIGAGSINGQWPGVVLHPFLSYSGANFNFNIIGGIFENCWNCFGPVDAGNSNGVIGANWINDYIGDTSPISGINPQGSLWDIEGTGVIQSEAAAGGNYARLMDVYVGNSSQTATGVLNVIGNKFNGGIGLLSEAPSSYETSLNGDSFSGLLNGNTAIEIRGSGKIGQVILTIPSGANTVSGIVLGCKGDESTGVPTSNGIVQWNKSDFIANGGGGAFNTPYVSECAGAGVWEADSQGGRSWLQGIPPTITGTGCGTNADVTQPAIPSSNTSGTFITASAGTVSTCALLMNAAAQTGMTGTPTCTAYDLTNSAADKCTCSAAPTSTCSIVEGNHASATIQYNVNWNN